MGERLLMRTGFAEQPTALIMFDLDHFKAINDKFGHGAGDEVLVAFCRSATAQLRANDLFGRIGGEEFASLLPNTTPQHALWLAERVRAAVEAAAHSVGDHTIRVTVSVGVALSNDPTTDLGGLLQAADQALYRAKEAGRNCVETSSHLNSFRSDGRRGYQFRNDLPRRMDPDSPAAQRPFLALVSSRNFRACPRML
jgi:diguanylate cyclase (GGDEF)-like protein